MAFVAGVRQCALTFAGAMLALACNEESPVPGGGGAGGQAGAGGGQGGAGEAGAATGGGGSSEVAFGLNDVSVLFPLPETEDSLDVLRLDSSGSGGPLLPENLYEQLDVFTKASSFDYGSWIVVAARIDPCFPELKNLTEAPALCRRQLRLVAQPYAVAPNTLRLEAFDQGLHLLYDLSETEFEQALSAWHAARTEPFGDADLPLGVHPTLMLEGLNGSFGTALREVIQSYAGAGTLSQLTFMRGRGTEWEFGGFKVVAGALSPIQIHGLDPVATRVTFSAQSELGPYGVEPLSPESATLMSLAGELQGEPPGELILTANDLAIKQAFQLTLEIENPTAFNPDTTDCASCHFASRARERARSLGHSPSGLSAYENDAFNLSLGQPKEQQADIFQLRAFGWKGTEPVFIRRTINESAVVAAVLNQRSLSP